MYLFKQDVCSDHQILGLVKKKNNGFCDAYCFYCLYDITIQSSYLSQRIRKQTFLTTEYSHLVLQ